MRYFPLQWADRQKDEAPFGLQYITSSIKEEHRANHRQTPQGYRTNTPPIHHIHLTSCSHPHSSHTGIHPIYQNNLYPTTTATKRPGLVIIDQEVVPEISDKQYTPETLKFTSLSHSWYEPRHLERESHTLPLSSLFHFANRQFLVSGWEQSILTFLLLDRVKETRNWVWIHYSDTQNRMATTVHPESLRSLSSSLPTLERT